MYKFNVAKENTHVYVQLNCTYQRWMKSWGVAIAGEKKMRAVSAQVVGENLKTEAVPLSFCLKDGGEEIRPAPMAYIPNLWQKIEDMLNESDNNITEYTQNNTCLGLGVFLYIVFTVSHGITVLSLTMRFG